MLDEFKKCDLKFKDKELSSLVSSLNINFGRFKCCFVDICTDIYKIWSYCKGKYWLAKDNEMYNSYKILEKFGFDKKAVNRYKNCYERFIVDSRIEPLYSDFTPSKLFELLPLSRDTLYEYVSKKLITPDMTVKQIREFIKSQKDGEPNTQEVTEDTSIKEEDIPMAYDPKQKYEFAYFETKTKNQLLNMIWELQKEYLSLKNKLNKEKKKNDTN